MDIESIKEFRAELKKRVVKFTYIKVDGTVRNAEGTMLQSMLPKLDKTACIKCSAIEWSGNTEGCPKKLTVKLPEHEFLKLTTQGLEKMLSEAIKAKAVEGSKLLSFEYARTNRAPQKLSADTIFYYDVEKSGFRAFNESQLSSWEKV